LVKHDNVTGVGFRWRIVGDTGWLGSSVVERPWVRALVEPQFFTCYNNIKWNIVIS